jgi:peptide/nickel transport system substrate-binding protein
MRVAITTEPASLNPDARSDDAAFIVCQNLFNKLVTLDADYRVIPDLAETWEVSGDGLAYTFHLARGAQWHDGQPLTSADVQWTLEAIRAGGSRKELAARIAAIETPDPATVILRLKEAWSPFLPTLAWYGTFILPKHVYEGGDWADHPANDKPVGSGPFKFVEWVKGDHLTLAANREYFKRGPFLDRVVYRFVPDAVAGADLLTAGDVEYLYSSPSRARIAELEDTPGIKVLAFPHPARYYLGFNLRRDPFDDPRARRAVNMAIDRAALVERSLSGYGAPGLGFYTPLIAWAYNPDAQAPPFDLAGARALLDEAGLAAGAGGIRLKLTLVTVKLDPFTDLALGVQEQLRAIGLEVEIVSVGTSLLQARIFEQRDFDLVLADGTQGPDPDNLQFRFGSSGGYQFMGYSNPDFDTAVAEGARLVQLKQRADAYFRAQDILARDLPIAPLAENVQFVITRDRVSGLAQGEARGLVTFQDYSLVKLAK